GFGYLNRKFGMSSDNILDAEIVLANGTIIHSVKKYPELFWTIRGAGNAGYGIITALTLRMHPIHLISTHISLYYDIDQAPLLFSVTNQLGCNIHENLTLSFTIYVEEIQIDGYYLGPASEVQPLLQEYVKLTKPKHITYTENNLYHLIVDGDADIRTYCKIKSFLIDSKGLSDEGIKTLVNFIKSFKCEIYSVILLLGGGKVNEVGRNETAFVHRGFMYHMIVKITLTYGNSEDFEICLQELDNFSQEFRRNYTSNESYQNMIDRELDNWQCRYYDENFERLVEIKRKYDPHNLFYWVQ
ncbi:16342_t:CDS:1, partial [Gigaspora margarita]